MPEKERCSRCGKEITFHQWLNNTLGVYLFPEVDHEPSTRYTIAKEYCRFSFCRTCYTIAREEVCV